MKVGENDISAEGKQGFIKLIEIPYLPGDMKFHDHNVFLVLHTPQYRRFL
jgi:hypothetical protein